MLEIPYTYHFYWAKLFTDKLNKLVEALRKDKCLDLFTFCNQFFINGLH